MNQNGWRPRWESNCKFLQYGQRIESSKIYFRQWVQRTVVISSGTRSRSSSPSSSTFQPSPLPLRLPRAGGRLSSKFLRSSSKAGIYRPFAYPQQALKRRGRATFPISGLCLIRTCDDTGNDGQSEGWGGGKRGNCAVRRVPGRDRHLGFHRLLRDRCATFSPPRRAER